VVAGRGETVEYLLGANMCLALYIAADKTLPLVPWNENAPAFFVVDLPESEQVVHKHLSKPHVYYAGAYEGCGCAFNVGREYPPEQYQYEPEELAKARESVARLVEYVSEAGVEEIFTCWEGDQAKPPVHFRRVRPEQLQADGFVFQLQELLTIERTNA
jgi:hypothetical protein